MQCFDAHIHIYPGHAPSADTLIAGMEAAGITGGAVFSYDPFFGRSIEERLESLFAWVGEYTDRIFPFFWIHPREENVEEKIRMAVSAGVRGFKMIPTDYSVAEPDVLAVIGQIASAGKPITLHSGILYDFEVGPSSGNNRPVLWENLLTLDCPVCFSLAHVSWPWNDECLALLGKMRWIRGSYRRQYAEVYQEKYGRPLPEVQMLVDTAPGPGPVWREDLFRRMFVYMPSGEAFMFGTDCSAHAYSSASAAALRERDEELCRRYATKEATKRYFGENFLSYIGEN